MRLVRPDNVFIRSRLLLLVFAWALPAVAGLLAVVLLTARAEQAANERTLRDVARAMSMLVERELDRRAVVARLLAGSRSLQSLPTLKEDDAAWFRAQAREALTDFDGWLEVHSARGVVLDTRRDGAPEADDGAGSAAADWPGQGTPSIGALQQRADGARIALSHPVLRDGATIGHVVLLMPPSQLQRLVDAQRLPEGWISTVMDSRQTVVARQPGAAAMVGQAATTDIRQRVAAADEGAFDSRSLDGVEVRGYYRTSASGWTYIAAMPQAQFGGVLQGAAAQVIGGATVLLLLAVAGALWVSHGIARAVTTLKHMAAQLSAGRIVEPRATGITECDDVAATLAQASSQMTSARAELERQVAQAVERTRAVEQQASRTQRVAALGRLTGGVAHDFNNLLGVIGNSAHLLERQSENAPQQRVPVGAILRAVDVGSRLTQQLMRFAGRRPLRPQPLDLARWREELEPLLRQVMGKRVTVDMTVAEHTPPVRVDSGELELAMLNIALNARDAMPSGGELKVQARTAEASERRELPDQAFVVIDISDTGAGMDAETATRVFEPFFTTKPVGEGTGLGLAQVHGFCVQAGGAAHIESRPGQGTTVRLLLPAAQAPVAPAQAQRRALPDDSLQGLRVMVVEDNDALGEATAALLRTFGAEVERVHDAISAVDAIERGAAVDVVLSDVLMPGPMDGIALGHFLRQRSPPLPVVLTSGYAPRREALQDFAFLQKPVRDEQLVGALRAAVGRAP
jgi:signal transduction histidine kinase